MRVLASWCVSASIALGAARVSAAGELRVVVEGLPPESERARRLAAETGRAYEEARPWFDVELRSPVTVEWMTDDSRLRARGFEPGSVAGLAFAPERRIGLVASALTRPDRIRGVLLHEICHLLFARATEGAEVAPPRWLNEGVAMWRSGEWDLGLEWSAGRADRLVDAAAAGTLLPLAELDAGFPRGPFFGVAYAQSVSFVEWLVQRGGEGKLRDLLRRLDEDVDPEPAFQEVYGVGLAAAESAWHDSLRPKGWLRFLPSGPTLFTSLWAALGILVVVKFVRTRLQLRRARDELEEWDG